MMVGSWKNTFLLGWYMFRGELNPKLPGSIIESTRKGCVSNSKPNSYWNIVSYHPSFHVSRYRHLSTWRVLEFWTWLFGAAWPNLACQLGQIIATKNATWAPQKVAFWKEKISYFRNIQVGLFIVTWLESDIQKIPHWYLIPPDTRSGHSQEVFGRF